LPNDVPHFLFSRVQSIFGGITEIQKEIIARSLGL
jgi:alkylation response protein AidB-like acyl-CoA dehydrogenase